MQLITSTAFWVPVLCCTIPTSNLPSTFAMKVFSSFCGWGNRHEMMLSHVSRNPGLLAFQWDLSTAPRAFLTVARGALPSCLTGRTLFRDLLCRDTTQNQCRDLWTVFSFWNVLHFRFFSSMVVMDVVWPRVSCFSALIRYSVVRDFFSLLSFLKNRVRFTTFDDMNSLAWNKYHFLFHQFLDFSGRLGGTYVGATSKRRLE